MANKAFAAASSSAPSSSASTSYRHYDVFISHRGPEVKNTFAAHLYRRLVDNGLQVFLDKPELLQGHPIASQIHAAIKVASVNIAIFSPRYAESSWCLEELDLMVKSRATFLPAFYKVKPSDLRRTMKDGAYAEALHKFEKKKTVDSQTGEEKQRYDSNTIQNWRRALSHAADISGFELYGDEEELLISEIVKGVLKSVSKPPLYVAKHPTGLEEKIEELKKTLLNEDKGAMRPKVVGIVGFGGVGKTTLAKEFFNRSRSHYNESSFLSDVREKSARMSLNSLQTKLIEDLKHRNIKIENPDEGIEILKRNLSSCHALIILDDVDNASQLEMLLPVDVLSAESLILVTTRDKHVLKESGVSSVYNMTGLNTSHSKELFCSYAFHQSLPPTEFAELVDRFVKACNGLPLSLKVNGALLCEEDEQYWECQLVRLSQTLPKEIEKILRISYDSLCKEDQPIFLDIACFYLGGNKDRAIRIWDSVAIRNLENKCLLEVDSYNRLRMHDHIRDCARSIAQEESMPLRLWYQMPTNVMDALLKKSSSVEIEVRGIATMAGAFIFDNLHLCMRKESEIEHLFNNSDFRGMKNLRYVATIGASLEAMLRRLHSPQLSWLQWHGCSCSSLPDWIPMENLRVLDVQGNDMESLWREQSQGPLELRELRIIAPLSNFPKSIGQLQHLEWIHITAPPSHPMSKISTVETLPEEFCHLSSLKYLVLEEFSKLNSLPDSFGKLTKLQHISSGGASSLQRLPDSFGKLTKLQHISLKGASSLQRLPDSFGKLTKLQHISLGGASSLQRLPDSFGKLTNLQHISLEGASSLQRLPDSFGKLTNLQHINLDGASSLQRLPNSFGNFTRLKYLCLRWCSKLTISNGALANIARLEYLNLEWCSEVKELPPRVAHQRSLKELYLQRTNLKELPCGIGDLCNLEILEIGNDSLELLPSWLGNLKSLKRFALGWSPKVKCLPDSFGMLTQLRELMLFNSGIEYLPQDLPKFNNLVVLIVYDCPLREVSFLRGEGEAEISSLEGGSGCNKLDSANDKCMFGLKYLSLCSTQISEVVFFNGVCPNLDLLNVSECSDLKSIQGLGQLTKLTHLNVNRCREIEELAGVEHCMELYSLDARDCPKLRWGGGVLQQLRGRLQTWLDIDVKQYKRRKLCA